MKVGLMMTEQVMLWLPALTESVLLLDQEGTPEEIRAAIVEAAEAGRPFTLEVQSEPHAEPPFAGRELTLDCETIPDLQIRYLNDGEEFGGHLARLIQGKRIQGGH